MRTVYTDERVSLLDRNRSKSLMPYRDMNVTGHMASHDGRTYITDGALYMPSGTTRAYVESSHMLYEVLGHGCFSDYIYDGRVTTEYGSVLDLYRLDRAVQYELIHKYADGWISVNDVMPEPGMNVMVRLEDGTVTWAEAPVHADDGWDFYGVCWWQHRK